MSSLTVYILKFKSQQTFVFCVFFLISCCFPPSDVAHPTLVTNQEAMPTFLEGKSANPQLSLVVLGSRENISILITFLTVYTLECDYELCAVWCGVWFLLWCDIFNINRYVLCTENRSMTSHKSPLLNEWTI